MPAVAQPTAAPRFARACHFDPFRTESLGNSTIVRFCVPALVDESIVEPVARRLFELAEKSFRPVIILRLDSVEDLTSDMLGYLLALQRRIKARGGQLILCDLHPELTMLFRRLLLNRLFTVRATEEAALAVA
jgi:anti-sigma B factor antagonist